MENYKIRVNNEVKSKEAQELFFELGYGFFSGKNKAAEDFEYTGEFYFFAYGSDFDLTVSKDQNLFIAKNDFQEINLPQLRDLVVLKRNNFTDATHTDQDGWKWFISSDNKSYVFGAGNSQGLPRWDESSLDHVDLKPIQTVKAVLNDLDELREEYKGYHKDSALISGADALRALADGKDVQVSTEFTGSSWHDDTATYTAEEILAEETAETDDYNSMKLFFRLKPQTIKLELDLPKPFEPKEGDEYWFINNYDDRKYSNAFFKNDDQDSLFVKFGAWRTEEDIKQVVKQLRKIKGAV